MTKDDTIRMLQDENRILALKVEKLVKANAMLLNKITKLEREIDNFGGKQLEFKFNDVNNKLI